MKNNLPELLPEDFPHETPGEHNDLDYENQIIISYDKKTDDVLITYKHDDIDILTSIVSLFKTDVMGDTLLDAAVYYLGEMGTEEDIESLYNKVSDLTSSSLGSDNNETKKESEELEEQPVINPFLYSKMRSIVQ